MSDQPRGRSRFDQTEPEPPRKSRFDRRSRSPVRRSRSPAAVSSPSTVGGKNDTKDGESSKSPAPPADPKAAALAAAAAAARINAQLQEKAKNAGPGAKTAIVTKQLPKKDASGVSQENGDFQKDIEINHRRNRYLLTKAEFQKKIREDTGADVTTKGVYIPDGHTGPITQPPLYLQITAQSRDALDKALKIIEEKMDEELPTLIDERRFRSRREPEETIERDEYGRRKWPDASIPIPLEPIPGFNLRAQVVGHGGAYVKYIQQTANCRVQIKGRGSGFIETNTGRESDEQMYLHITARTQEMVDKGKELALELLGNVKKQYDEFKANGPSHRGGSGGPGGHRQNSYGGGPPGGQGGYGAPPVPPPSDGGYGAYANYGGGYGNASSPPPPPPSGGPMSPAAAAPPPPPSADPAAQYAQYYQPQQPVQHDPNDPYAPYGGYDAYMQYYAAYYQQTMQAQAPGQAQMPGQDQPQGYAYSPPGSAPPPPPDAGSYNAVPPPPGM